MIPLCEGRIGRPRITPLLAARPEVGRGRDTAGCRIIGTMGSLGIIVGTAHTAMLPARYAATSPEARDGH